VLLAELIYVFLSNRSLPSTAAPVPPQAVGALLFGPYLLGVELASVLLMAGLVGAYHLGQHDRRQQNSIRGK
jgi:NADH-quinone oxidoreductase subunit J